MSARKGTCWERGDVSGIRGYISDAGGVEMQEDANLNVQINRESERARIWANASVKERR